MYISNVSKNLSLQQQQQISTELEQLRFEENGANYSLLYSIDLENVERIEGRKKNLVQMGPRRRRLNQDKIEKLPH